MLIRLFDRSRLPDRDVTEAAPGIVLLTGPVWAEDLNDESLHGCGGPRDSLRVSGALWNDARDLGVTDPRARDETHACADL